ncbi:MAG: hypothetical protein A4E71_01478 [Smithella sp. PtaU1.Bin162]|nr:MAG: hypothetical protein A4E71_01478 [Smithella sp. PtaU1.Bin162]
MKRILKVAAVGIFAMFVMVSLAMAGQVNTVLVPISSDDLGVTYIHEHLTYAFPGLFNEESLFPYDREAMEAKILPVLYEGRKE